eukprot:m.21088 g.21088  ORF g.21088 m.21088 type:complete len:596 (-) comp3857_c0_seq1:62-1849(-)
MPDEKPKPKLTAEQLLAKRGSAAAILAKTRATRAADASVGSGVAGAGSLPRRSIASLSKVGLSKEGLGRSTGLKGASTRSMTVDAFSSGFGGVGAEKAAIVLDIGAAYTKCGFSNEATPRHVVPTETIYQGRKVRVYDPQERRSTAEMNEILISFLHTVFYQHLLVKTTDRRIVLVEPVVSPALFRRTLVDLLFRHYLVLSILHVPAVTASTVPLWLTTALVVDCGYTETTVVAVFDGVPAVNSFRAVPAGAVEVHSQIRQKLSEAWPNMPESTVEDVKVRACIAGTLPEGTTLPTLKYSAVGLAGSVDIDHDLRTTASDSLFDGVADGDASSIPGAILDALVACSVDARKRLAHNIVLCGGTAMLPGFRHRLVHAIASLATEPEYAKLVGAASERSVVKVTLAAAEMDKLDVGDLRGNAHRILDDLTERLRGGSVQVSDAEADVVDGKVVCVFRSPDKEIDEALIRKDKSSVLVGRRTYTILDIAKSTSNTASGVLDAIAFAESSIPENILPWVGGSILGTLESLASKSITREMYLKNPTDGLDYTANCLTRPTPAPQEPKPPPPEKWKVKIGRPMAWGCGSLAVPPEVKQHAV